MRRQDARDEKGQSAVEFALMLPVFLIVIAITVEFGVGLSNWISVTNATREGARYGAVGATTDEIKQAVIDKSTQLISGDLDASGIEVVYHDLDGDGSIERGESVEVCTTYNHQLIGLWGPLINALTDGITFRSQSDMRLELGVSAASGGGECGGT
jgi:hypothetical protein